MNKAAKIAILMFLLLSSNAFALIGSFKSARVMAVNVAASNAPQVFKDGADYLCNGTNDEVQIQAALDDITPDSAVIGSSVILSPGLFQIGATIDLVPGVALRGQGVNITILRMVNSAEVSMFEFDDVTGLGWVHISDMYLFGNKNNNAAGHGIDFKVQCKDFYLSNVFISDFSDDGLHIHGTWGHVYDSIVAEFCEGTGINLPSMNKYEMSGDTLATAGIIVGETYTQAVSGASGRSLNIDSIGASTILITSDDDSNPLDGTNIITFSGSGVYDPTAAAHSNSSGPKITNCKLMDNDTGQLFITRTINAMISNCEFKTSNSENAIELNGCNSNMIRGCQFTQIQDNNSGAYIAFVYTDLGSNRNLISDNIFTMTLSGSTAVTSDNNNNIANLISNNICTLVHSASNLFDESSSQRRNKIFNNYVIPLYVTGSTSYQEITADKELYDLPNTVYSGFHYAGDQSYSNALYDQANQVNLPTASSIGMISHYLIEVAQELRLNPQNGDTIYKNDGDGTFTALAAGEYIVSDTADSFITLKCLAVNKWYAVDQGGVWVEESP